jgi:hypothetical protein
MSSVLESIGPDDKKKLDAFIAAGLRVSQEIVDLRDGLKDTAKSLAEELGLEKPAVLLKAVRTAFKSSLEADKTQQDTIEDILTITGHA